MSRAKFAILTDLPVYPPFLERICAEESEKYKKDRDKAKAVKTKLHQAYGAYYSEKNIKAAEVLIKSGVEFSALSEQLAKLSVSSRERSGFAPEFYKFIFESVPSEKIASILDLGCGFNPFFLPQMTAASPKIDIKAYHAFDIGTSLVSLVNQYFALAGLPECARCMDAISEIPKQAADMAFLFKIVPTLENRKKGRGFEIMENLGFRYAAVSFPTRTLGGKNINMAGNYADFFEKSLDREKFALLGKNLFSNELVYVLGRI
ncbi:MAG: hypothetical protein FWG34_10825 [Oscillospiraceae bacterium]|nr:hypothetical protein [Oscillospiraceae bacterium]